ncbi:Gfo/Idh/MocA family protein [Periweissella beninensis]|uniref:Gfo/Idh/MocA family oxidoreductase n=1 Tax=Periweissella beninensis TaxID=504936 RepID=A0ABT0VGZ5_9LACO|nr:Gfo/Idh/MocA family oxidoreductase [Periweissella beninensis]MBM7543689.1 putative dehydrogenase [Periweissella beninensis]MCM2436669.1 Gfo/Idh/MocA family oxidoreductase [Periweissella beninensis]MCT4395639.1 gfo/Idh/MocA family oxidoreductase [Periweissella beninensis]
MTIQVGTIGTSWITQQFIEAIIADKNYQLAAIYSRDLQKAQHFNVKNQQKAQVFDNLEELMTSNIDLVYIASPNGLHFKQIIMAIENEKNVIVEKPAVITPYEFKIIEETLAKHPHVKLFEAARHIHQVNFKAIQAQIEKMKVIQGATFVYNKYSSRFDAYLAGENPNVLNPEFAGGALEDLGVYPVYSAITWFGMPQDVMYFASKLANGADGRGTAILRYQNFDVTLIFGKNSNSYLASEIYGLKDSIVIDNIAELTSAIYHTDPKHAYMISSKAPSNPMSAEVAEFASILNNPNKQASRYEALLTLSKQVNSVLDALRKSANLVFPNELADK